MLPSVGLYIYFSESPKPMAEAARFDDSIPMKVKMDPWKQGLLVPLAFLSAVR
jgi:hypothetical protein